MPSSKPSSPSPSHHHSFSQSLMEENMETAASIINKWNPDSSPHLYLFTEEDEQQAAARRESIQFINSIKDLQKAMHFFASQNNSDIVNAHNLMRIAMKRLEKEFHHILSTKRYQILDDVVESISGRSSGTSSSPASDLDSEETGSEDDIIQIAAAAATEDDPNNFINFDFNTASEYDQVSTLAMSNLRLISESMISAGYTKECLNIYNMLRKSIVDETLYHLGVEQLNPKKMKKMEWNVLDMKIKIWVRAVDTAVKTLFAGERILCDYVFSTSDSIRESCFTEIARHGANMLFSFPEMVVKGKKSPEKMFRILDIYDAISQLWPDIEIVFSFESTSNVRAQAVSSLIKLGDAVRSMLTQFESAIQKDTSKTAIPGGGIHPLTRYVMNYISFLSDYSGILSDITEDWPLPDKRSLPDSYFENNSISNDDGGAISPIAVRFAWLILVLLCKLDSKTQLFKDVSLSYLFLANNLNYVISKVRSSSLKFLLGTDWISKHEMKVRQYTSNYQRMGWSAVVSSLPQDPLIQISPEQVKGYFDRFSSAFEATYRKQSSWVVSDRTLRTEIIVSISSKLLPVYQDLYTEYRDMLKDEESRGFVVGFTPSDIQNYLSDLFHGTGVSGTSSSGSHSH